MKINRLKILTQFRGLSPGYEVEFTNTPNNERIEPLCFIGLNGSGKSNVLEAISECFYYLEAYSEERSKKQLAKYKTTFGFEIEFELNPTFQDSNISWDKLEGFTWAGIGNMKICYIKETEKLPVMILVGDIKPVEIKERENLFYQTEL